MRPAFLSDAPAESTHSAATYTRPENGAAPPAPPPVTTRCANCGAEGCEQYCPRCGQDVVVPPRAPEEEAPLLVLDDDSGPRRTHFARA